MAKTALIIGASRGLGLGLVREYLAQGWHVIATTRGHTDAGLYSLAADAGAGLRIEKLDVTDAAQVAALRLALGPTKLDLLFVSAGVNSDRAATIGAVPEDEFMRVMRTNALAPLKIIEALDDAVLPTGAIVAMSSVLGSVAANTSGGYDLYRASKAALNTLLRSYAHRDKTRTVIVMHPGWVRTDMGGSNADVSVEDSAAGMVRVIDASIGKPGCVFVDHEGKTIAW